ncbi:MAG: Gfo/Idh/MocA family oxidoreductase [Candidatus Omnitrophota bacterium]
MKALVIGYGSIGSRHTRILKGLGCPTAVLSRRKIDVRPSYRSLEEALAKESPDYVVIATSTGEHFASLTGLKRAGYRGYVLVEKPLFASEETFSCSGFRGVFVAYDLRFYPLLIQLRKALQSEQVLSVQCYVGQYLPEWRPSTDYRKSYSASKARGGGVLRDLSHELDYLTWIFGPWRRLAALGGHVSHLEIDSDDQYCVLLSTQRCPAVTVQLNYLDRTCRRELWVNTQRHTFRVDLIHGIFQKDKEGPKQTSFDGDWTYRLEHEAVIKHGGRGLCTFDEGKQLVSMMSAIETAARKKTWKVNPRRGEVRR